MNCRTFCMMIAAGFVLHMAQGVQAGEPPAKDPVALESITVTANKTEENAQEIPMSITVIDDIEIQDRSIDTTERLFQRMPNMHMTKMGPVGLSQNIASVRGISSFMTGGDVFGFFVDDVFYPSADINLMDVERIEVLRGPQGTLYGKNTEAGVINIITRTPENDWGGEISLSYGNYDTFETVLAGGGALVRDKLFLRLAGRYMGSDGYFTNTVDNDDTVDEKTNYDGRLSLRYLPADNLSADLKINWQKYNANYAEFTTFDRVMDNDFDISVNDPGHADKDFSNASLNIAWDMDTVRLTSITTALDSDAVYGNDMDFTSYDFYRFEAGMDRSLLTQELRLNSRSGNALKWTAGAYFFSGQDDQSIVYDMVPYNVTAQLYGNTDATGMAAFGQVDYTLHKWVFTAGLRYEYEEKTFDYEWKGGAMVGYTPCAGSTEKDFDALLPKFALTYHATDHFRPYASVTKGFKSGGFNLSTDPGVAYDAEYTWNYELGFKSELAGNRVQFNAALFYIDWKDLQVEQPSYPDYIVENAAQATSKGVEVEVILRLLAGLEVYGSLGYVDATFDEYTNDGVDYSGKDIPNAPSHTYSLGATYRFLDHWMVNAELNGTGTIYYEADNEKSQSSYRIVDVKAGYETDRFDVYVWANNLFDQAYATRAFEMSGQWWARNGDPLTFGLTFRYRF